MLFVDDEQIDFCFREERKALRTKRVGYVGEAVTRLRRLVARKVIAVWPAVGSACVCPIIDHVSEELRDDLLCPSNCLLPDAEWPVETPFSKVHVDADEWFSICKAGYARGMMAPMEEDKQIKNRFGDLILSGAMGVDKYKVVDGVKCHLYF